jgi:hypothetical protein
MYEELYEWLDQVEVAISDLASEKRQSLDVGELPNVCSIINDLMNSSSAYYDDLPRLLRLPPALIRKFQKFSGTVALYDARVFVDRLRSHLKSMDQAHEEVTEKEEEPFFPPVEAQVSFPAIEWRNVPRTPDVKEQIIEVSRILDDIIAGMKRSNNAPDDQYLTEIERQQLIAILTTALVVLKAPVVEKGLLLKTRDALQKAAVKAGEKQAESAFNWLAGQGALWLSDLIHSIF